MRCLYTFTSEFVSIFVCWFNSLYTSDIWFIFFLHFNNATKKKSKFVNKSDQERLLQKFYDNLDNEESDYLGNVFENEHDVDFAGENISGRDSDPDDEIDMELDDNTSTSHWRFYPST